MDQLNILYECSCSILRYEDKWHSTREGTSIAASYTWVEALKFIRYAYLSIYLLPTTGYLLQ